MSTARRAAADRRRWPVRVVRSGAVEDSPDLSGSTTPGERLEMMWPLALEAWAWWGAPLPEYPRAEAPVARRRLSPGTTR